MSKHIVQKKYRGWIDWNRSIRCKKQYVNYKNEIACEILPLRESNSFKNKRKYLKKSWIRNYLLSKIGLNKDEIYSDLKTKFTKNDEFNYPSMVFEDILENCFEENNKIYKLSSVNSKLYEISHNSFYWDTQNNLQKYKKR